MVKLLLLAIIVWLLYLILKRYTGSLHKGTDPNQSSDAAMMVQCRHCGLHVPKSDSIVTGDDYYCCEEHRRQSTTDA